MRPPRMSFISQALLVLARHNRNIRANGLRFASQLAFVTRMFDKLDCEEYVFRQFLGDEIDCISGSTIIRRLQCSMPVNFCLPLRVLGARSRGEE